jgi:hypothetical protein
LYTPAILALRRQRQEVLEFKTSLGYIVRPCLKKKTERKKGKEGGKDGGKVEKKGSTRGVCSNLHMHRNAHTEAASPQFKEAYLSYFTSLLSITRVSSLPPHRNIPDKSHKTPLTHKNDHLHTPPVFCTNQNSLNVIFRS